MQAQHTDRQKAVPMFNAFQSKGQDDISRWLAKVSENPIVEAFPEKIDIHPGMDSSMLLSTEMPAILSELVSKPRTRRTVAYINVPYCETRCFYCLFYIKPYRNKEESKAFADTLIKELQLWSDKPVQKGEPVHAVYFGGGTPSYLGPDRLRRLLDAVFQSYRVAPGAEITLEANPDSAQDISALRQLHDAGFDRLSLGMQSADDAELRRIGRVHTHAQTVRAVENARAAGFDNLSLDLIYGLPEQTMTRWQANLDAALALAPEHLSCYGLKVEEGTPLFARRERFTLPDDDAQADMYLSAVGLLARQGYEQYEISNFCRPGRASRHNSRYWTLAEYLGFGPGAHSDFGGERFALALDLDAYLAGHTAYSERSAPSARERETERVMLALRTTRGVAADTLPEAARRILRNCEAHGLAHLSGGFYALTPRGFLVSNAILVDLLETMEL